MNFHILTLFPDMVENGLKTSITGRAIESGAISVEAVDIRDYTTDKHKTIEVKVSKYLHNRIPQKPEVVQ